MWSWFRNGLLAWEGMRTRRHAVSKETCQPQQSSNRTGSSALGWMRLLGAVAASRGSRRSML